jgi:hypothetical protein
LSSASEKKKRWYFHVAWPLVERAVTAGEDYLSLCDGQGRRKSISDWQICRRTDCCLTPARPLSLSVLSPFSFLCVALVVVVCVFAKDS